MYTPHRNFTMLVVAALLSCDSGDPPSEQSLADACTTAADASDSESDALAAAGIHVEVSSGLTASTPTADLLIRGVAEHTRGFAIRRIRVGGHDATSDTFNFGRWSVTIPLTALRSLPRDADGKVTLGLEVVDSCGTYPGEDVKVTMDVPSFLLAVDYPGDATYIPISGEAAAILAITADAADKGAVGSQLVVTATPSGAVKLEGVDSGGVVTLLPGSSGAVARVGVQATSAGEVTIQVRSASLLQSAVVKVAGLPRFVPNELTLKPGDTRNLVVLTDGELRECWATTAVAGIGVTLVGQDIVKAPGSLAVNTVEAVLTVAADAMIAADGTATVTCRDRYQQSATATVTVDL